MMATKTELMQLPGTSPGRNGVEIRASLGGRGGFYRSYEVYQRQRVKESTYLINARVFLKPEFLRDPYPALKLMRENYPFYRDWVGNCDWVTLYNDVTSIFVDDANFETRAKAWFYGMPGFGRDLREELPVLWAFASGIDRHVVPIAEELIAGLKRAGAPDLATGVFDRLDTYLLAAVLGLPRDDWDTFARRYRAMMDGWHWHPSREQDGKDAIARLSAYFAPLLDARRAAPRDDLLSAFVSGELESGPASAEDVVATLLEGDGDTLRGSLINMWGLLLSNPEQLADIRGDPSLAKRAWQEGLRHTTPVLTAKRFARQEVERFGRLIPGGGLVVCSAASGNRDAAIFDDPDRFDVRRKDLCYREPRGQYRADGLPAGIALGLGRPSRYPAVPEDRPRSLYAITRDAAVAVSNLILAELPGLGLAGDERPEPFCRWPGDLHLYRELPVTF